MEIVEEVYYLTKEFPEEEKYRLTSQMRRAAVSVPSNIAEGSAKQTGNFRRHIEDARGSLAELEMQLELAIRLGLVKVDCAHKLNEVITTVGKMLTNLHRSLRK